MFSTNFVLRSFFFVRSLLFVLRTFFFVTRSLFFVLRSLLLSGGRNLASHRCVDLSQVRQVAPESRLIALLSWLSCLDRKLR